jgi:hypothetical protein
MYYDFNWQSINNHNIWRFETLYIIFFCWENFETPNFVEFVFKFFAMIMFLFLGVDWIIEMEHAMLFTCGEHPHIKTHAQPRNLS